ncbi:MAG: O-antigen ligase family protein, partial [Patescibacteria group bacterium]
MKDFLKWTVFAGLFAIPFIPFLVSSSLFFPFITTKAFAWRFIIEIIFFSWLLLSIVDPAYRLKKSSILYAIATFLGVVLLADIFGIDPTRSIWSNYERMEGFISLAHLAAFFMVISSFFDEMDWKRWWNTTLVASFIMILYCSLQIFGVKTINQGGVRVDGTFGNAIYLAVYMLFHIFIAMLMLFREWKNKGSRYIYGILMFLQAIVLYYTATRGALLGLVGGLLIFSLLNIRNKEELWARKISIGFIAAIVILVGGFFAVRNAQFVKDSSVLSRFSTLSVAELKTQGRYFIWPMAWQGIKEHPVLGWGQENFTYVFQKYYRPEMYNLEPWFDRAHNVFLDWAIAGGLLSLFIYLSLYFFALSS